eukprot:167509-Pleurochrysis_carterae.AAC.1
MACAGTLPAPAPPSAPRASAVHALGLCDSWSAARTVGCRLADSSPPSLPLGIERTKSSLCPVAARTPSTNVWSELVRPPLKQTCVTRGEAPAAAASGLPTGSSRDCSDAPTRSERSRAPPPLHSTTCDAK